MKKEIQMKKIARIVNESAITTSKHTIGLIELKILSFSFFSFVKLWKTTTL